MMLPEWLAYGLEYIGLYYGTYRGVVVRNDDPQAQGRLMVKCPTIHGDEYPATWAYPIAPKGGKQNGIWFIPDVGETVYVRFDHGRVEFPFWEGGWWGLGEATPDMVPTKVVLATKEGMKVVIDRAAETVLIQQSDGNSIEITGGSVFLRSGGTLNINVQSDADITAVGDVNITAQGKVQLTGGDSVDITAPTIKLTGDVTVDGAGVITPAPWSTIP